LLNPTAQTQTVKGVTFTNNGDGTYTVNGTASGSGNIIFKIRTWTDIASLENTKIVGCPAGGSNNTYFLYTVCYDSSSTWLKQYDDKGQGVLVSNIPSETAGMSTNIVVRKGVTANNLTFKPMLTTDLNATYDDFVRYTGNSGRLNEDVAQINTDLSVKYNSSDDYIYMLLNGTWKKWHKAYLQNLYIFTSDGFADGFGIGDGQRYDSSYTLYGSMTQGASALVCTCKTAEQAYSCITLLSQTVDLTNYSTVNATFVANGGTYNVSVDVESLEGEHYIGLGYREGKYDYPHLSLDIKNVMGTYTVDGRVAGATAAMGAYITNSFTITRIWCE
jgi:hypothetical protein